MTTDLHFNRSILTLIYLGNLYLLQFLVFAIEMKQQFQAFTPAL